MFPVISYVWIHWRHRFLLLRWFVRCSYFRTLPTLNPQRKTPHLIVLRSVCKKIGTGLVERIYGLVNCSYIYIPPWICPKQFYIIQIWIYLFVAINRLKILDINLIFFFLVKFPFKFQLIWVVLNLKLYNMTKILELFNIEGRNSHHKWFMKDKISCKTLSHVINFKKNNPNSKPKDY